MMKPPFSSSHKASQSYLRPTAEREQTMADLAEAEEFLEMLQCRDATRHVAALESMNHAIFRRIRISFGKSSQS